MHILKQLSTKKGRDETKLFVVEGENAVAEIPDHQVVKRYVFSQSYANTHVLQVSHYQKRAPIEILGDAVFVRYSDTKNPQGITAICEMAIQGHYSALIKNDSFLILGETLQDPGNVGTLIRTAAAAGAQGVLLTAGSADIYNPKTLRAAAGAVLRLPVFTGIDAVKFLTFLQSEGIHRYAAHPRGKDLPYHVDMKKGLCLLIGNEAHGLSDTVLSHANAQIRLPMSNETESLNASTAGAVLLYEVLRQRHFSTPM